MSEALEFCGGCDKRLALEEKLFKAEARIAELKDNEGGMMKGTFSELREELREKTEALKTVTHLHGASLVRQVLDKYKQEECLNRIKERGE